MYRSLHLAEPRQANVSVLPELSIVELKSGMTKAAEAGKVFISEQQGRTFAHRGLLPYEILTISGMGPSLLFSVNCKE